MVPKDMYVIKYSRMLEKYFCDIVLLVPKGNSTVKQQQHPFSGGKSHKKKRKRNVHIIKQQQFNAMVCSKYVAQHILYTIYLL